MEIFICITTIEKYPAFYSLGKDNSVIHFFPLYTCNAFTLWNIIGKIDFQTAWNWQMSILTNIPGRRAIAINHFSFRIITTVFSREQDTIWNKYLVLGEVGEYKTFKMYLKNRTFISVLKKRETNNVGIKYFFMA